MTDDERERRRAANRRYRLRHPDRVRRLTREAVKRHREKHLDAIRRLGRERTKRWQAAHPEFMKQAKVNRLAHRAAVDRLKDGPCRDCGGRFPRYVMDWDHVRGEKVSEVAKMRNSNAPIERILDEIAKCDLVCSNCHRIRTHTREDGNYSKSRVYSGRGKNSLVLSIGV